MSFILDALKKSESDRQRQSGPALFEVKLAPPRTGLPPWGLAAGARLLVNLGVVMCTLLRHAATPAPGTPPVAAAGASAPPLPAPATAVPAVATDRSAAPAAPTPAAAGGAAGAVPNPEDFTPASEHAGSPTVLSPHVRRGTADGVPLYQDAAAAADACPCCPDTRRRAPRSLSSP